MDTYIAQAVAEAHLADLHREAARRRRARSYAAPRTRGAGLSRPWSALRGAVRELTVPTTRQAPDCCPA
jgi:hypothetical protein